jgi:hypothetical protein
MPTQEELDLADRTVWERDWLISEKGMGFRQAVKLSNERAITGTFEAPPPSADPAPGHWIK